MSSINEIFSNRLKRARIMRGLSMDALCEKMDAIITKQSISKYEKGLSIPGSEILISLSKALEVNLDYFFKPEEYTISQIEFRKKSKLGTKKVDAIKEIIRDNIERYIEIEEICNIKSDFINPIKENIITSNEDVYKAVKELKKTWNLGEDGIPSTTELLESHNIKVIELEEDKAFDGLSGYINNDINLPFIILNKTPEAERKRFTALHELGHIVLTIPDTLEDTNKEKLCNLFANEMLISKETYINIMGNKRNDISLKELNYIQENYGISVDALMFKAKTLDIITDSRYKYFCIKKNQNKSLKKLIETSRYITKDNSTRFSTLVYKALASDIITESKAAHLLGTSIEGVRTELAIV